MTAEEAIRVLDTILIEEPTEVDPGIEDALESIKAALMLAYTTLDGIEWATDNGGTPFGRECCLFCGRQRRFGHASFCTRQATLRAIKAGVK